MPEIPSDLQLFVHSCLKEWTKELKADEAARLKPLEEAVKLLLDERNQNRGVRALVHRLGWFVGPLLGAVANHYLHAL